MCCGAGRQVPQGIVRPQPGVDGQGARYHIRPNRDGGGFNTDGCVDDARHSHATSQLTSRRQRTRRRRLSAPPTTSTSPDAVLGSHSKARGDRAAPLYVQHKMSRLSGPRSGLGALDMFASVSNKMVPRRHFKADMWVGSGGAVLVATMIASGVNQLIFVCR